MNKAHTTFLRYWEHRNRRTGDVIDLGMGSPAMEVQPLPPTLQSALVHHAVSSSAAAYEPQMGSWELRELIARQYRERGIQCEPTNILVTPGALAAVSLARKFIFEKSRSIVFAPDYFNLVGAQGVVIKTRTAPTLSMEDVDAFASSDCESVLMTNPNNPLGVLENSEVIEALVRVAAQRSGFVLVDETCHCFLQSASTPWRSDSPRLIRVGSASKIWNLAGYRIGWLCADTGLIERLGSEIPLAYGNSCVPAGRAIAEYLHRRGAEDLIMEAATMHRMIRLREFALERLRDVESLELVVPPSAAFYALLRISSELDGQTISRMCLDAVGVDVLPGEIFGIDGPYVRICVGRRAETLERGISALEQFTKSLLRKNVA